MLLKDINTNDKKFSEYSSVPLVGGDVCAYRIVLKTDFDLTGCRASVSAKRSDGRVFSDVGEVNKNLAVYIINSSMYSVAGEVCIRMNVISNDGSTVTDKELIFNAVEEFGIGDMCTEDGRSIADVFTAHMENTSNPHDVTADQLGLGDVQDKIKGLEKEKLSYTIASSLPDNAYLGINCAYFIKYNKNDYDAVDNPNAVGYRMYMGVRNNNTYVWSMIGEMDDKSVTSGKIADNAVISSKIAAYSVTNAKIASGAVGTDKIYDKSVTSGKIADSAVTNAKIASGAVVGDKISNGAVSADKIAAGAVTSAKIADSAVTNAKIAAKGVTGDKIADNTIKNVNLARDSVDADNLTYRVVRAIREGAAKHRPYLMSQRQYFNGDVEEIDNTFCIYNDTDSALSYIYAGDDYGWELYEETDDGEMAEFHINPGEMYNAHIYTRYVSGADCENGKIIIERKVSGINGGIIDNETIDGSKLAYEAVDQSRIKDNSVTDSKIAAGAVTENKISNGAVSGAKIADGAVTGGKISGSAVSSAKIASGAVTEDKISGSAVSANKIASGAVTNAKIADGAVTGAKIAAKGVTGDKIADNTIKNVNLARDCVDTDNLTYKVIRAIREGAAKHRPYLMSERQYFNGDVEEIDNTFCIYNDTDSALSYMYAGDDYGWELYEETDDGEMAEFQVPPGEMYNARIYTRYVSGADCENGKIIVENKVSGINGVIIKDETIDGSKLAYEAVDQSRIKDNSVTGVKIADGAVSGAKIASGAVTEDKISGSAVSSAKIASGAVTNAKIADGAVTGAKIAAKGVTGDKIADNTIKNVNLARDCVDTDNLTYKVIRAIREGAAKHRPYLMSERQYFNGDVEEIDNTFCIYNDTDSALSYMYAGDDYGWELYEETDDGEMAEFQVHPGEMYNAHIYTRYVSGADCENGKIIVENKVSGINGVIIKDETIDGSKLAYAAVGGNQIASAAISMRHLSPELQALLAKIK